MESTISLGINSVFELFQAEIKVVLRPIEEEFKILLSDFSDISVFPFGILIFINQ